MATAGFYDDDQVEKREKRKLRQDAVKGGGIEALRAGDKRRARFIECIQADMTLNEACAEVGWQRITYERNRQRHPQFRLAVDQIRLARVGKSDIANQDSYHGGFGQFRKAFFGHDSPDFHLEVVRHLEYGQPGSVTMILLPPEHGKTTLVEDFCNYKLALDPTYRITVGSEGQPHARKVLRRVKSRMEPQGPAMGYVTRYGPFAPVTGEERKSRQPWGADFFDVYKKDTHDDRDYSMVALGWRSAIAGTRTDLMIVDDIQSRKSLTQTNEMFDVFRQDWLSRPGSKGRTVVLGTRVEPDDFYERLIYNDIIDNLVCIPAVDNDGKFLWPERYTAEEYKRMRRNVGEDAWWRNYMQKPRSAGDQCFLEEYLQLSKNEYRTVGEFDPSEGTVVLSLDPALGGGNCLTAAQFSRQLKIIDQISEQNLARTEQILDRILDFTLRYRPTTLIIEKNAFQRGLARDDRLLTMASTYGFRIVEHQTGNNKRDETFGVASMAQDFGRELIDIPFANEPITRARMEPLYLELEAWRPDVPTRKIRQDRVMSLWFAWLRWRQFGARKQQMLDPIKINQRNPFKKTTIGGRVLGKTGSTGSVW